MKSAAPWARIFEQNFNAIARNSLRTGTRAAGLGLQLLRHKRQPPAGAGDWIAGIAIGPAGARRYRLYRPPDVKFGERLPLMVMLHGCGQDSNSFANSTRMNRIAARERFLVLYPEQDRLSNAQGCWNWFETRAGRAAGELQLILGAVEQVCGLYSADRDRIAVAGLSAGASMAALLVIRHPGRFKAVVMHSGIAPGSAQSGLSALAAMHGHGLAQSLPAHAKSNATPWPPLLVIHGGRDQTVAASNGHAAVRVWAEAGGASPLALRGVQRGQRHAMTITDFKAGAATVASLVVVPQLGHAWSGGAASHPYGDSKGPDASRMAWSFAATQFSR